MEHIRAEHLCKTYHVRERPPGLFGALRGLVAREVRTVHAVEDLSLAIRHGERVGYVGPNGAGKSTTIKMMTGLLVPSGGHCVVNGRVPWRERVAHVRELGAVFGQRTQLWWDLPVMDSFEALRDIYRIPAGQWRTTLDELVSLLGLSPLLRTPTRQLSLGEKMRCEFAAALLHSPKLLVLDEPTIGLDAPAKIALREFLKRYNRGHGATIFLTTHDLDDIEAVCDRVVIINAGRLVFDGDLAQLRRKVRPERWVTVDFQDLPPACELDGIRTVSCEGRRIVYAFEPDMLSAPVALARIMAMEGIVDLSVENAPIEAVVASFYEGARK